METNYPAVICQGKQQWGRGGPGQVRDKQPSQATLFMAFLCISVFIWTFLSWRAGLLPSRMPQHLHGIGCHQQQVICCGAPGQKASTGLGRRCPWGPRGWCLCPWAPPFGLVRGSCFRDRGEVLEVQAMDRSGRAAGPCSWSSGVGRHSGGLGAGGHWELCLSQGLPCFHSSLPSQLGALCLH